MLVKLTADRVARMDAALDALDVVPHVVLVVREDVALDVPVDVLILARHLVLVHAVQAVLDNVMGPLWYKIIIRFRRFLLTWRIYCLILISLSII